MRLSFSHLCVGILFTGLAVASCSYHKDKQKLVDISEISPSQSLIQATGYAEVYSRIFQPRCISCHGNSGGVNLESYATAHQYLSKIHTTTIVSRSMPKNSTVPLSIDELNLLEAWIQAGGPEFALNGSTYTTPPVAPLTATFASIKSHIFEPKCVHCHNPNGKAKDDPLDTIDELLQSDDDKVVPGHPEESMLITVFKASAEHPMPPPDSGYSPLTPEQIQIISDWIQNGAKD